MLFNTLTRVLDVQKNRKSEHRAHAFPPLPEPNTKSCHVAVRPVHSPLNSPRFSSLRIPQLKKREALERETKQNPKQKRKEKKGKMLGLRAVLGYAGPVQDTAAGNGIAQWWDEIDGSLEWQRRLFYALCAAYSLVALVALVNYIIIMVIIIFSIKCEYTSIGCEILIFNSICRR